MYSSNTQQDEFLKDYIKFSARKVGSDDLQRMWNEVAVIYF
jgi:hypothetical protein